MDPAQAEGCADSHCALGEVKLGAATPLDPNSLLLEFETPLIENKKLVALLDSGSTHSFVDSAFAEAHELPSTLLATPLRLRLFDGSSNCMVTDSVHLNIRTSSGDPFEVEFLVTRLDSRCSFVLGYDWLKQYNPLVDWVSHTVTFRPSEHYPNLSGPKVTNLIPSDVFVDSEEVRAFLASGEDLKEERRPHIAVVGAIPFLRAAKSEGAQMFQLAPHLLEVNGRSSSTKEDDDNDDDTNLNGIPKEYREFADVFSKGKADSLPPHRPYDLKIDLEDGKTPPLGPIYPTSQAELDTLREFINEHLNMGFIQQSKLPCGAPVLFVKKKDGSLRLCIDFRGLNRITKKDRYPLPLIQELLDAPRTAKVYSKIDLCHAYHLVRIAEGDEWKTVFRTRHGTFEWLVMPFGLSNAPSCFQRFMNDIFRDLLNVTVIVYLDDILIFSDDKTKHKEDVKEVLQRLRKYGLYAKASKCEFHVKRTEFLGYILTPEGVSMEQGKVDAILSWPTPRNVKDIQRFLGFANFYRRFVFNFSGITAPLTRATRKGLKWDWTPECQRSFDALKEAFTTAPCLAHFASNKPLVLETDASDYALAAILSQYGDDGELHPIAFRSRTFTGPELNYDVHDKELLAIYDAFQNWRPYLEGLQTPIDVVTDHKNLEYFSTTKLLTRRQVRWSEYLNAFHMVIRYRPGKLGGKPDALTRRWDVYPKEGVNNYAAVNVHNYHPIFTEEQLNASLRATSLVVAAVEAAQTADFEKLHEDIRKFYLEDPVTKSQLEKLSNRWTFSESDKLLRLNGRIYVPASPELRTRVLKFKHDHPLSGHFGQNKTMDLVRRDYNWPDYQKDVKNYCNSCMACSRNKPRRHKPYGEVHQIRVPELPWNSILMDFIEKLPDSNGYNSILVVVDRFTKQGIFIPCTVNITSPELAVLFVQHVFSKHGVPSHVTSDRSPEFVSLFFRSLGKALNMELHFTSGYHPEGDGQTERLNQTLEQYLRIYCNFQQDDWSELLPLAEFAYNNAPSSATGVSPFFANKGYHPQVVVTPELDELNDRAHNFVVNLEELHQMLQEEIIAAQDRYQKPADSKRMPAPEFEIGGEAMVKAKFFRSHCPTPKLSERYFGPYKIIGKVGTLNYVLKLPDELRGIHPVFHVSMLEPVERHDFPGRDEPLPAPIVVDFELEYEIDQVLDSKINRRFKHSPLRYLVRWTGYQNTDEATPWLGWDDLEHANEAVADFHRRYPNKPGPIEKLAEQPGFNYLKKTLAS